MSAVRVVEERIATRVLNCPPRSTRPVTERERVPPQSDSPSSPLSQLAAGQKVEFVLKSIAVADGLLSILGELPAASDAPAAKKKKK